MKLKMNKREIIMNKTAQMLSVSSPPFWHYGRTLKSIMCETVIALLPVVVAAVMTWGFDALRVVCLSVAVSVLTEALCQKLMAREYAIDDFSAVLSGMLLAFMLPAAAPWWLVTLAAFFAITMGKMAFGDLGSSPLCAPVVGYILCFVSFPIFMNPNTMQLATEFVDPLFILKSFSAYDAYDVSTMSLLMGQQISALGAGQVGLILLGGLYLCFRGIISIETPVAFMVGVAITALIFSFIDSDLYAGPIFHLCTGSTMLGAFFLATDFSSSPNTSLNMIIYGLFGGALVVIIRIFGIYADGVPFAILLINLIMPLLEGNKRKPIITE